MNINGIIIKKLNEIQEKESKKIDSEFFNYNKFLLFSLALSTKKTPVLNSLIKEQNFSEREIEKYISKLSAEGLFSQTDAMLMKKITGNYESKNYEQEIDEIITHFNRVANKRSRASKSVKDKIISLLKTNEYVVKDFKKVNLYFSRLWSRDPKMSQYVNMDTFFRLTKFDEKLNKANDFFDELNSYKKETKKLCQHFKQMIIMEFFQRNRLITSNQCPKTENLTCDDMPLHLQSLIIHWLKLNYTIEEIIETIEGTIENWSKTPKFSKHISLNKILDEKFPLRASAVQNLKEKGKILKSGVSAVEDWINKEDSIDAWVEESKSDKKTYLNKGDKQ